MNTSKKQTDIDPKQITQELLKKLAALKLNALAMDSVPRISRAQKLDALSSMDDATVRSELIKIKGIGRWTADIYLLMALNRPDIWPRGDLALASAVRKVKRLRSLPDDGRLENLSEEWRPWRAVAARLFWHYYLSSRKTNP